MQLVHPRLAPSSIFAAHNNAPWKLRRILTEGIDTKAERDFLSNAGIRLTQGYLFSKPAFRSVGVVDPSAWD